MSENQQPLEEQTAAQAEPAAADETVSEQTGEAAPSAQAAESLPEAYEDEEDSSFSDDTENAPAEADAADAEEEEDIDPADVRIFGMPRVCFHLAAGGVAVGYIVCGLIGLLADKTAGTAIGDLAAKSPGSTVWAIAFAIIGYLIGKQLHKKRLAAKEAALSEQTAESPET